MFEERLRYIRKDRGMTQEQLAVKVGASKQSVSNWENNNILPGIEMLKRLSDYLNVSTDYLLGKDSPKLKGGNYLEVTGLKKETLAHLQQLIDDLRNKD